MHKIVSGIFIVLMLILVGFSLYRFGHTLWAEQTKQATSNHTPQNRQKTKKLKEPVKKNEVPPHLTWKQGKLTLPYALWLAHTPQVSLVVGHDYILVHSVSRQEACYLGRFRLIGQTAQTFSFKSIDKGPRSFKMSAYAKLTKKPEKIEILDEETFLKKPSSRNSRQTDSTQSQIPACRIWVNKKSDPVERSPSYEEGQKEEKIELKKGQKKCFSPQNLLVMASTRSQIVTVDQDPLTDRVCLHGLGVGQTRVSVRRLDSVAKILLAVSVKEQTQKATEVIKSHSLFPQRLPGWKEERKKEP